MHPSNRRFRALKQLRRLALLCLAALTVLSCTDGVTGPSDVVGGEWRLASMRLAGGTSTFVPEQPGRFTVEFKTDGFIGVRADCNSCGGGYTLAPGTLAVTPLACTRAYCGDTSLDPRYPGYVSGARSWETSDGRLIITADDATLSFSR